MALLLKLGQRAQDERVLNPEGAREGAAVTRQADLKGRQKAGLQRRQRGMSRRDPVEGGDERRRLGRFAHAAARAWSVTKTDLEVGVSLFSP